MFCCLRPRACCVEQMLDSGFSAFAQARAQVCVSTNQAPISASNLEVKPPFCTFPEVKTPSSAGSRGVKRLTTHLGW